MKYVRPKQRFVSLSGGLPPLGAQGDARKWEMPGWRIEKSYSNNTLIHSWQENRLQNQWSEDIQKEMVATQDYPWNQYRPDVLLRKKSRYPNRDLPTERLFGHHGSRHDNHMISLYDENYSKRVRPQSQTLPQLRKWDRMNLCWMPEKSDFPVQDKPTNWGLREATFKRQEFENSEARRTHYVTSYSREFYPKETQLERRLAAPMVYMPETEQIA